MALRFNPFVSVLHNTFTMWRLFFHIVHVSLGLPGALCMWFLGTPWWLAALLALVLSIAAKLVWMDWPDRRVVWNGWSSLPRHGAADMVSDILLAQLGVVVLVAFASGPGHGLMWLVAFYFLETFNGT